MRTEEKAMKCAYCKCKIEMFSHLSSIIYICPCCGEVSEKEIQKNNQNLCLRENTPFLAN